MITNVIIRARLLLDCRLL